MKKRLALGFLFALGLALVLLHTQPIERLIFKQVQSRLAALGWQLDASRFDLNLFKLSAKVTDLKLIGQGTQARLKHLYINANLGMLFGQISLAEVEASQGKVQIDPQPSSSAPADNSPLSIPPIQLGKARLDRVFVTLNDQQRELDLTLNDIGVNYNDSHLSAKVTLPEFIAAGRSIPQIAAELDLETTQFQVFQNIRLNIASAQSLIEATGAINASFEPDLQFTASLGQDLLPEHPGTRLEGEVTRDQLKLHLENAILLASKKKPWTLDTQFNYREKNIHAPIQVKVADLMDGTLSIYKENDQLRGEIDLKGDAVGISALDHNLAIREAGFQGEWRLPQMDPKQLVGQGSLLVSGTPSAILEITYQEQKLRFKGNAKPVAEAIFEIQGEMEETLAATFSGELPRLGVLQTYIDLPNSLDSSTININGAFHSDFNSYTLRDVQLDVAALTYGEYFKGPISFQVDGTLEDLRGSLFSDQLNPSQPAVRFHLDALGQEWHELELNLHSQPLPIPPYTYQIALNALGQGPLLTPSLTGNLDTQFNGTAGPVGKLSSNFIFEDGDLALPDISAFTHHGHLKGNLNFNVEKLEWQTDIQITGAAHQEWLSLTDHEIPRFVFEISGHQDNLDGKLVFLDKDIRYGDWNVPIKAEESLEVSGNPDSGQANARMPVLEVAGIQISDLQLGINQGQLQVATLFNLKDAGPIKEILGEQWPEALTLDGLEGQIQATSDLSFEKPKVDISLSQVQGTYLNEPITIADLQLTWTPERLDLAPVQLQFAGTQLALATTSLEPEDDSAAAISPLDLTLEFESIDSKNLAKLFKDQWPQELGLQDLRGHVRLRSDWQFETPIIDFSVDQLGATYDGQAITTQKLTGTYSDSLWLSPGQIQVGDLSIEIAKRDQGIAIYAQPNMEVLSHWVPGIVGDAVFDVNVLWDPDQKGIQAKVKQVSGRLIYPEPWLEVVDLDMAVIESDTGIYKLEKGHAMVNNRPLTYSGNLDLTQANPDLTLLSEVTNLPLSFADYQFDLTSVVEWRLNETTNQLTGTLVLKDGYLSPQLEVEGLVQELLAPVPAIYFPDPLLEKVKLQVTVLTETPVVVEHPLGYWELETPSLIIGGNLAAPYPDSGTLSINEGSVLRQGRNTFLFQNSQIQFHSNRVGDPYLQIAMVEAGYAEDKQPIYFTGYVSEFDQNLGNQNITTFFLGFLLGRVTSLVSFEIQINDTLADSSFTTWVSRRLTDKAVVRYAIPLNDQNQRLEVKFGPFWRNFINFAEENNQYSSTLRHAQRFGFLNKPPEKIKKVIFKADNLPKGIRRKFKLKRGEAYSETRQRYAEFDLERRLKMLGYLASKIDTNYSDRILTVSLSLGPKYQLMIEGLDVSDEEKRKLFLQMQGGTENGARHLELLTERLAISKGHPSAAAFADFEEQAIRLNVYVGHAIDKIQLNFDQAQPLLGSLYATPEEARRFIIKYFVSASDAESELRARLAAKGYVRPVIQPADFPNPDTCQIPIDLGPRAVLFFVVVNGDPWEHPLIGQPFEYSFLGEITKTLSTNKAGDKFQVRLQARRDGQDIFFDVDRSLIKDREIQSLTVEGAGRIPENKIRAFLGFKKTMPQSVLSKNQERLIETGSFTLARMRTTGDDALLNVRERNRWDVDYELSYDDVNEIGVGVQFRDRMMFKGFNPMGFAVRQNRIEEELVARQQFLRVFGSPIDLFVGLRWNNERLDLNPSESEPLFDTVFVTKRPRETREINAGLSFRLFENQLVTAGILWQDIVTRQFEEGFFIDENGDLVPDPTLPPTRLADLKVTRIPLRTSWLYSNLDNELYPKTGIFSQVSYEYFPRELGTNDILSGWRALGKFNNFLTRGRWRWWQRLEAGLYQRELRSTSPLEDDADSNLFFLGGPKSIRGFSYQKAGPLRRGADDALESQGGQAMAIFTQELNYDLNFYGLGISPFVDGGWVWRDREDFLKGGIAITGGLGLTLETPIGRFRFDWATPLDDRPLDRMLQEIYGTDPAAIKQGRDQVLDAFSIRFGRVF